MIKIRPIQPSDNATVATIIRSIFDEFNAPKVGTVYSDPSTDNLFELFDIDDAIMWIATDDDNILGCCGVYPTQGLPSKYAELAKFYLSPKARGKGIGKALFQQCSLSAKELGYTHLYLESIDVFITAVQMYKKLGFKSLAHPLGYSGHESCPIWMLKEL